MNSKAKLQNQFGSPTFAMATPLSLRKNLSRNNARRQLRQGLEPYPNFEARGPTWRQLRISLGREYRNPKSEGRKKAQVRNPIKHSLVCCSDFGFRPSFGFRLSDFGFT